MLKAVKSLLSASIVYGLGTVASKFIGLFLLPVFTRYLEPAEYGIFETVNVMLFLFAAIGSLGMDSAMLRFYYDSDAPRQRTLVVSTALFLALTASIFLASIGFVGSPAINAWLFKGADHLDILHITMLTVVAATLNTVQLALFQTKREPGRYSLLTFLRFAAMYGLSVIFLIQGAGVAGVMLSQLIAYGLTLAIGFVLARKDIHVAYSHHLSKEMLAFSAPLIVGSVCIWLLSSSDRFFLIRLSNLNELGLYSLGSRLASIVLFAVTAFQMAWPQFALARANEQNAAATNARMLTYYLFVGILIVVCVSLFTPELLSVFATASYAGAGSVVLLLSCSFLFYGCYFVFGIILSMTKRTLSILPITVPPLVVSVALNSYLVPGFGGVGSAVASTCAYLLMAALTFVFANRLTPVRYEWSRIAKPVLIAAAIILAGNWVRTDSMAVALVLKTCLVFCYFIGLLVTRFFLPIELQTIKNIARQFFFRTS